MFSKEMMKKVKTLPWRQASGLLCILLVLFCFYLDREQTALSQQLLRLHVLANSDGAEDQALKLRVRDQVLALVEPWAKEAQDAQGVAASLKSHIPEIEAAALETVAAAGYQYPVAVQVEETWFPTRHYEDFSLPAGNYESLRVIIGEGAGQNWWCVVFPPLCTAASTEEVEDTAGGAGLSDQEVFLILEEGREYVIKFRAIELWEELKHSFEKKDDPAPLSSLDRN